MNRWLAACIVLVAIFIASVYILIPSRLIVTKIVLLNCNRDGADRVLGDTGHWARWWPRSGSAEVNRWPRAGSAGTNRDTLSHANRETLSYEGVGYCMAERLNHAAAITIDDGGRPIASMLTIFPLIRIDSSYLQWQFTRDAGWDPLKRIGQYREASRLKGEMAVILDSLRSYLNNPANIYGVVITEGSTMDSLLVETGKMVKGYPGTGIIYDQVKTLDQFILRRGGKRTGYPMVNIDSLPAGFLLRTAIPVDREYKDSGDIVHRKLVRGSYLESDVRGGAVAIDEALNRMKIYIADYRRTVMAIPFFSLITDRTAEPDSTKWMTRIYYPIY